MWDVKFSAAGEEGRSRQIAKLQHNGTLTETLGIVNKLLAKQSKAVNSAIVAVRLTQVGAASAKEPKFKI